MKKTTIIIACVIAGILVFLLAIFFTISLLTGLLILIMDKKYERDVNRIHSNPEQILDYPNKHK